MRRTNRLVVPVLLAVACATAPAPSFGASANVTRCKGPPESFLLRYTLESGEIRHNTDWLSVTVYPDGCVAVHRPTYFLRPGDHAVQLDSAEFEELVGTLDRSGVFAFDPDAVARNVEAVDRQRDAANRKAARPETYVSHEGAPQSVFETRLSADFRGAHGLAAAPSQRRYAWSALGFDAERYPEVGALAALERMQQRLLAYASRGPAAAAGERP